MGISLMRDAHCLNIIALQMPIFPATGLQILPSVVSRSLRSKL